MLINGTQLANAVLDTLANRVRKLDHAPHLAAVMVGDDPALRKFIAIKKKAAEAAGIQYSSYVFAGDAKQEEVAQTVRWLARDGTVDGIFIELPLPETLETQTLLDLIPEKKDVDMLTTGSKEAFYADRSGILPPSVRALEMVLAARNVDVRGLRVAVIGRGELVGRPVAHWLAHNGADVESIDIGTPEPHRLTVRADIVVCGAGVPGLVTGDWVRDGALVIDYGFGKRSDGTTAGDVDATTVGPKAAALTPIPGGMGPLVVAALLENVFDVSRR